MSACPSPIPRGRLSLFGASTYILATDLFRFQDGAVTRVETAGYRIESLHGRVVGGVKSTGPASGERTERAMGYLEGDSVVWHAPATDWEQIAFTWESGENDMRVVTRPPAESVGDESSYRFRPRRGGSWGSISLPGACGLSTGSFAVDREGNALVLCADDGLWYLPTKAYPASKR